MAIFHLTVWQGPPQTEKIDPDQQAQPVWQANILAQTVEESYRIGKARFAAEHPDKNVEDYTMIARGDSVEKSIAP